MGLSKVFLSVATMFNQTGMNIERYPIVSKQQGPMNLQELRGTVAVVTGAGNNGIGWGICCHAARELGMHVVALDLHDSLVISAQQRLRKQFQIWRWEKNIFNWRKRKF